MLPVRLAAERAAGKPVTKVRSRAKVSVMASLARLEPMVYITDMANEELRELLRAELAPIVRELADLPRIRTLVEDIPRMRALVEDIPRIRALVDGIPPTGRAVTTLQQELRMLRTAFNDFARTAMTAGEVEALHTDVNKVQADFMEFAARLARVERQLEELKTGADPHHERI